MNFVATDDLLLASIQGRIFLMELLIAIKAFTLRILLQYTLALSLQSILWLGPL